MNITLEHFKANISRCTELSEAFCNSFECTHYIGVNLHCNWLQAVLKGKWEKLLGLLIFIQWSRRPALVVTYISRAFFGFTRLTPAIRCLFVNVFERFGWGFLWFFELCQFVNYLSFQVLQILWTIALIVRWFTSSKRSNNRFWFCTQDFLVGNDRKFTSRLSFFVRNLVRIERHCLHSFNRVPLSTHSTNCYWVLFLVKWCKLQTNFTQFTCHYDAMLAFLGENCMANVNFVLNFPLEQDGKGKAAPKSDCSWPV